MTFTRASAVAAALGLLLTASSSQAADPPASETGDPAFKFGARAKVTKSVLIASANVGLLIVSGNSNVTTFSGGTFVSWKDPNNRFTLDASVAYARQYALSADDTNGNGVIDPNEIKSESKAGAQNWYVRPRYDRFLTEDDSIYISPAASSDVLAGKELTIGGQLGYSRRVYAEGPHEVTAELGYDFTHERYVEPPGSNLIVHSARAFVGYKLKLADDVLAATSVEGLTNIATEVTPNGTINPLVDTRVNWRNQLTARVWKNISGRFSFITRFDNWPAPRPPFDIPYAPGLVVAADKLDAQTEFAVVVTFL